MAGVIDPRYGVEVYTSDAGKICIAQDQPGQDDVIVILHPDEARQVIKLLQDELRSSGLALVE